MKKQTMFTPRISRLVCSLILIAVILPIASAVQTPTPQLVPDGKVPVSAQGMDITIYGSHYIKENRPFNYTNGLYTKFIYHGEGSILINASITLRTRSTRPMSFSYVIAENFSLPAEATGQTAIAELNFGIGFITFTITIDGCGEFAGMHFEKTAYGLCLWRNAFIAFQR